ncbi:hypothetical protein LA52FAK_41450 [Desulforhopalus sp. 52FAK]
MNMSTNISTTIPMSTVMATPLMSMTILTNMPMATSMSTNTNMTIADLSMNMTTIIRVNTELMTMFIPTMRKKNILTLIEK